MSYNKARAEKKWIKWKNAEEQQLRELGVDEEIIQRCTHTIGRFLNLIGDIMKNYRNKRYIR